MNEQPDEWYEGLKDREENPDLERPHGVARDIKDEAVGRAKDRAVDAGKDLAKKVGKEAAKQGAKAGAEAGTSAAAGSGTAAATGAGIAATTGVETAGVGAAVGAAVAVGGTLLSNKTFRKILYIAIPLLLIGGIFVLIAVVVMAPIVILAAVTSVVGRPVEIAHNVAETTISTATIGTRLAISGAQEGKDLADDTAGWVEDNTPIEVPLFGATSTPHDPNSPQVLAAQTVSRDSRLFQLSKRMDEKGFFKDLKEKYGLNIVNKGNFKFDIKLDDQVVHRATSLNDALQFLKRNERIRERLMYVMDAEHIYKYGKRVTFAEAGMEKYQSTRLFIPEGDTAENDEQAARVKQSALSTVNVPFLSQAVTELRCSEDCGDWVPNTVTEDQSTITGEVSAETGFLPKDTLYSAMKKRVEDAENLSDDQIIQWFNYVRELKKASEDSNVQSNEFIQGILNTRKQQSGRLWFNWQTQVDQLKAGKLTTKSGNTLFKSLANISGSKAFQKLNGLSGGEGFREYEKINENQANPATIIYTKWKQRNGEYAEYIDKVAGFNIPFLNYNPGNQVLLNAFRDNAGIRKAMVSAFRLGSEVMIPTCDSNKAGAAYFNCLYAGAETSYRDIGIEQMGFDGNIPEEDYRQLLAYADDMSKKVAAQKPLQERLFSIDGSSSFARAVLMNAIVPLQTSGSFVDFQANATDIVAKLPSIFGSVLSPNAAADIDENTSINNINPAGIRIDTLLNAPLSATLNEASGSAEECPQTQGANTCKTHETALKAFQGKYDLLPQDENSQFAGGMRVATFNILHAPDGNVPARLHKSIETLLHPPDGGPAVDVAGLQEVRQEQLRLLKSNEYLGNEYEFFPNTTENPGYQPNIVAWKKGGRFNPLEKTFINARYFHGAPEKMPVVKFQDTQSGQIFYFASIHDPRSGNGRGDNEDIRDGNARIYAEYFANLKREQPNATMILVGDFNAGYQAADTIEQVERGRRAFCILTNGIFWDAWHAAKNIDEKCPKRSGVDYIDHIFIDKETEVSKFFAAARGIDKNGSDHPTIFADIGGGFGNVPSWTQLPTVNAPIGGAVRGEINVVAANIKYNVPSSLRTIKSRNPDFITVNEVRSSSLASMESAAPGYGAYRDQQPDDSPGGIQALNNVIMWRKDRWRLLDSGRMKITDDDKGFLNGNPFVWDRYATWGVFKRNDGAIVSLISTHMMTNPTRFPRQHDNPPMSRVEQYSQSMDILLQLTATLARHGPVLVGGDMNSHPGEGDHTAAAKFNHAGFDYAKDTGVMYVFYPPGTRRVNSSQFQISSDHPALQARINMNGVGPGAIRNINLGPPDNDDDNGGGGNGGFAWPIARGDYAALSNCWRKPGHTGIDIPVSNQPVRAAAGGVVAATGGPSGDAGNYIILKHSNGKWSNYQHLSSKRVSRGDNVAQGDIIGISGNTGFSTGPHLHFSITTREGLDSRHSVAYSVNPLGFLPHDRDLGACR